MSMSKRSLNKIGSIVSGLIERNSLVLANDITTLLLENQTDTNHVVKMAKNADHKSRGIAKTNTLTPIKKQVISSENKKQRDVIRYASIISKQPNISNTELIKVLNLSNRSNPMASLRTIKGNYTRMHS